MRREGAKGVRLMGLTFHQAEAKRKFDDADAAWVAAMRKYHAGKIAYEKLLAAKRKFYAAMVEYEKTV